MGGVRQGSKRNVIFRIAIVSIITVVGWVVFHTRVVSYRDNKFLAYTINYSRQESWTLFPVQLHTPDGLIRLKAFTSIQHEYGKLSYIYNKDDNIEHDIIFWGNKIDTPLGALGFYSNGNIREFNTRAEERQKFCFKGVPFEITALFYSHDFEPYPYLVVLNFSDIILGDGTKISMGPPVSWIDSHFLKFPAQKNWTLHNNSRIYFIAEGPLWETPVRLTYIEFEENWGKVIDYRLAKE